MTIEQAKDKLAERLGVDMDQAVTLVGDRARASNRRLCDLAQTFINGTESLTGPAADRTPPTPPPPRPKAITSPAVRCNWSRRREISRGAHRLLAVA